MGMDNINCPCKRTKCERYGNCDACREHHKNLKSSPWCDRQKRKNYQRLSERQKTEQTSNVYGNSFAAPEFEKYRKADRLPERQSSEPKK